MNISLDENDLIDEVCSRRALWDPTEELHSRLAVVKECWYELATSLFPDLRAFPLVKQNEFLEQVRRKWHYLRTSYRKSLQNRTEHPFADKLSFLTPIFQSFIDQRNANDSRPQTLSRNRTVTKRASARRTTKRKPFHKRRTANRDVASAASASATAPLTNPVLSLAKIDNVRTVNPAAPAAQLKTQPASDGDRKSVAATAHYSPRPHPARTTPPVSYQAALPYDSDDEHSGDDDGGGGGADRSFRGSRVGVPKRCKYRYEMQMASAPAGAQRMAQAAAYATLSFEDDEEAAARATASSFGRRRNATADPHRTLRDGHDGDTDDHDERSMPVKRMRATTEFPAERVFNSVAAAPGYEARTSYRPSNGYAMVPAMWRPPPPPTPPDDEDMAFFRSLLTWTRRFNEDEKLEFRTDVMKLVSRMRSCETAGNYYVVSQTPLQ